MSRTVHRVLVVDDDHAVLECARAEMPGRTVLTESDGRQVAARVTHDEPDLVVVDQWLGDGVYGHEIANGLKQRNPDLLVALVSGGLDVHCFRWFLKNCRADYVDRKTADYQGLIMRITGVEAPPEPDWDALDSFEQVRRDLALRSIARCGGNKSEAARRLKIDRTTLIRWLRDSEQL